ncbi:MAG: ABC transporter ATP-binding protein [Candidatus Bipolaricaulaceae bacterium]
MTAKGAAVTLREVSFLYAGTNPATMALEGITMTIDPGEFVAVVGPSGCGKTTLLKLVAGLILPTTGEVLVDGERVTSPLKIVGMAFQNAALLPWRTTLRNILLPLEIVEPYARQFRHKKREYIREAQELLALVGLEGFSRHYPWQLSGGMQQRVSLCRALIHSPKIILLDEPFGALDAFTREELWLVLERVWLDRGTTAILVTHDLREAAFLAKRVFVMSARPGRILSEKEVNFPYPRELELIYTPAFTELVHALRQAIGQNRTEARL